MKFAPKNRLVSLAIVILGGAGLIAREGESGGQSGGSSLSSPGGTYYVRGNASLDGSIHIHGEGLPEGVEVEVHIADDTGAVTGVIPGKTGDDGSLEVESSELPPGSDSLNDLAGHEVEVVSSDDGHVLLEGSFPKVRSMDDHGEGSTALKPPVGAPIPGASGRARVKALDGRHALEVKVRGLKDLTVYMVKVTSTAGQSEIAGQLTTHGGGNGALKVDSDDGGAMPLASGSIADLTGATVQVIDPDGQVVLEGILPAIGQDEANEVEVEVEIEFPESSDGHGDGGVRGSVQFKTEKGAAEMRFRLRKATPGAAYDFTIRPADAADRTVLAHLTADGSGEIDVTQAGALPLGATQIADLAGDILEVVDAEGKVLLATAVPALPRAEEPEPVDRLRLEVALARPEGAAPSPAHGEVELEEEGDEHVIELEAEDLVHDAAYRTEIRDPSGAAEVLFEGAADAAGDFARRADFLFTDRLPFAVASFRALDGFTIVLLDAEGAVVLEGKISAPAASGGGAVPGEVAFTMVGSFDAPFLRGDSNRDFAVDISDVVFTLGYLFQGGPAPTCADAMDANDDGALDISDAINTLFSLYGGGAPAQYPGMSLAGFDPSADGLFCHGN
jgi:hypothetical protein